jgi:hypothetical protein
MAQQGVIEPLEEVGYRNRPPLLEDVSVEGPFRIPIPHALDTIEQRDAIEEDYNWWRYSKFAAPWLIFLLLLFALIFTSTAFQQAGDYKAMRNGTPRYYQLQVVSDDDYEAGIDIDVRGLRAAMVFFTILPAVLAFLVLFSKPRPGARKAFLLLIAFLFFTGSVLGWISFGIAESDNDRSFNCAELRAITYEDCEKVEGVAVANDTLDFLIGLVGLTAALTLAYVALKGDFMIPRKGWRQQERDAERIKAKAKDLPGAVKPDRVYETRMILTVIVLVAILLIGIADIILMIILHQYHDIVSLRSFRGRTSLYWDSPPELPFEEEGWSARNTRLRYAWSSIGILVVLANFLPWRSRVIAYIFAFIYFCLIPLCFVSFALDVHEMRESRKFNCPAHQWDVAYAQLRPSQTAILAPINTRINCINSPYVSTAFWEFFTGLAILFYIFMEYLIRSRSVHSQRKYPWHQIRKIERELDSRRPVRCELTNRVMTAKEYYYRHRFLAGPTTGGSAYPTEYNEPADYGVGPFGVPPMGFPAIMA